MLDTQSGMYRLMLGILDQAIDDLMTYHSASARKKIKLCREAHEWLFTDETQWPFSAVNVCVGLGLELDYIRRGINELRAGKRAWVGIRTNIARFKQQYDYDSQLARERQRYRQYGRRAA